MNQNFIDILQKLVAEQGKETLLNAAKSKAFLSDYTRGEYKKESRVFLLALEGGVQKAIDTAENITVCKKQQIRLLHEEYSLDEKVAVDVVDTLALILRGDMGKTVIQAATGIADEADRKKQQKEQQSKWVSERLCRFCGGKLSIFGHKCKSCGKDNKVPDGFVRINGGTFIMGSPYNEVGREDIESPQHQVTVNSFFMGKYQVTQSEYKAVMGTNPSHFKGDNLPVEKVSWFEAVEYCNRLSHREGLSPVYKVNGTNVTWNQDTDGYRLPTEAEWEYACRAGTITPFSTGYNITTSQANFDGNFPYNNNAKGKYRKETTVVGSFEPNPWGLYDMHGNVWEWCWDWKSTYLNGAQADPIGAVSGDYRVIRGGGWLYDGRYLRSAYRGDYFPSYRSYYVGFRLMRP
jgi:formylglycine-generating enzyme required for sulfatase activity